MPVPMCVMGEGGSLRQDHGKFRQSAQKYRGLECLQFFQKQTLEFLFQRVCIGIQLEPRNPIHRTRQLKQMFNGLMANHTHIGNKNTCEVSMFQNSTCRNKQKSEYEQCCVAQMKSSTEQCRH